MDGSLYLWEGETLRPRIKATFTYGGGCCVGEPKEDDDEVFFLLPMLPRLTILVQALMTPTIFSPHSATYIGIYPSNYYLLIIFNYMHIHNKLITLSS